jgi:hypothetical protein
MQRSLAPPPVEIARLAAEARAELQRQVRVSPSGDVLDRTGVPLDARTLLESLAAGRDAPTWERCCHELAALVAAERAIFDRTKPLAKVAVFSQTATTGRGAENESRRIAAALRFPNDRYEWPGVLAAPAASEKPIANTTSIAEVAAELEALRVELVRRCQSTEYLVHGTGS